MSEAVRNAVIVGGGLAGWYCAARLGNAMQGRALNLRVVRAAPRDAAVDPLDLFCASLLSSAPVALAELGFDERALMRACDATFKLATEYRGFSSAASRYLLPFGEIGARFEAVGFHQFIGRLARSGHAFSLDDFAVPSVAASLGRFAHPTREARSVLSTYEYAYHVDVPSFTKLVRSFAEKRGALAVEQDVVSVDIDGDNVRAITLGDGTRLEADLFIDCSGARSLLLGQALRAPFESWRAWLPCDAAVVARLPAGAELPPFTRVQAQAQGWSWHVPLRSAIETAVFYDSRATPPQTASEWGAITAAAPRELRFENGLHRESWRGNCVAIGAAAGFVEPLASTGLRLIDGAITQLIELFPDRGDMRFMAAEFNRLTGALYDRARDFVLLHYLLSDRTDAIWGARATPPPESLERFLDLFRHRGRVAPQEDEMFEEAWWACACIGLGVRPAHFAVLAEQMSEADLLAQLAKIARVMRTAVEKLPPHRAYLQGYLA
jgi:tryptophan halogenase